MAIPSAIISHLRIVVSSFAVMAMHAGGPHTERKTVKDFAKSIPGEREEMAFAIRIENRFDSPFVRDNALGQGELFAFVRTCMDDARVIEIVGKPHDDDFGFCRFHKHRRSEGLVLSHKGTINFVVLSHKGTIKFVVLSHKGTIKFVVLSHKSTIKFVNFLRKAVRNYYK